MTKRLTAAALIAATLFLSGCDSSEDRAEEHFQAAMELLQEGDTTRAILEMRNALQLMPEHEQARQMLAQLRREEGDIPRAISHYRKLVEDFPQNGEGQLALAELAMEVGDWNSVERHTGRAAEILGDTPAVAALQVSMAYRDAVVAEDREAREAAAAEADAIIETDPSRIFARRVSIDSRLRSEDWLEALPLIDAGIEIDPDRYELYQMRLGVLEQLGRTEDVTAQLEDMVARYPEKEDLPLVLVRWYVGLQDFDAAEAYLRQRADEAPENLERQSQLIQFVDETSGFEAAQAELERLAAMGDENVVTYRGMLASLMFRNGDRENAVAELESVLVGFSEEEAASEIANDIRVDLARMKALTGDTPAAKELVATVLESDPGNVAGLKMRGAWRIEDDEVEEAIVDLRAALRESPRDPQIMTLMAAAHERAGDSAQQREMLSLAVEASGSAPGESLRYAQLLLQEERYRPAEDVLIEALRLHRDDFALYAALGQVYVALADWPRAEQVADSLGILSNGGENAQAEAAKNSLKAQILAGQERDAELMGFLSELSQSENTGLAAKIALIRTHAARGELDEARTELDAAIAENPDLPMLQFLSAALKATNGQFEEAETEMEAILEELPQAEQVWMALYRLNLVQGNSEAAAEVLDRALEAIPESANLMFSRAGELERKGDIDGAIAIYETLYDRNSSSELVANNLASLLSMYRSEPEAMERAYRIGRRLQDSSNAAMRDTYGWIATRLGRLDEGEEHLRFAVEGIPDHPVILYHYAATLDQLGRNQEALDYYRQAEEKAGDLLSPEDLEAVTAAIARLEAAPAGEDSGSAATDSQ
ncbi:tetratricopeptide repeat protein [Tropicimonas sp. IMCC6043]|uniref:tetratricopeptide repeat protein n=1 Tax=Tropicimonas sp. IMCC6043 TaxID=2510645 RepID=UPI00101D6068|nr:tetratricopeptide repeat protein [Tropicimonas sp. IMCC6043]RYH10999.1 tetratricopeptide repeat protein [Tropicimonas sp. IMCC6043]